MLPGWIDGITRVSVEKYNRARPTKNHLKCILFIFFGSQYRAKEKQKLRTIVCSCQRSTCSLWCLSIQCVRPVTNQFYFSCCIYAFQSDDDHKPMIVGICMCSLRVIAAFYLFVCVSNKRIRTCKNANMILVQHSRLKLKKERNKEKNTWPNQTMQNIGRDRASEKNRQPTIQ